MADIIKALNRIQHEFEINYEISCFFDSGFRAKIGDELNGYTHVSFLCDSFEEAAQDLINTVSRRTGIELSG